MGVFMNSVCNKCFVGYQFIMIVKENKIICLKCDNKLPSSKLQKYEEKRMMKWEIQNKLEIENIYNM